MTKTNKLYIKAKKNPGGTQLLSKRPEMLAPDIWPEYFSRAKNCEGWDLDNKHYYDFSTNNVGTCLLGFGTCDAMQGANHSFISSTYWTDRVGSVAALAKKSNLF
jgi:glutamate-1-semialdehyde 2,1-aminomutase